MNLTGVGIDDPDVNFYENYYSTSDRNYSGYKNPEVDKLIDAQSAETDREKRKKLVWEIEKMLADDVARPIINYNVANTCWDPKVKGVLLQVNSIYNGWRFEDVWLGQVGRLDPWDRYLVRRFLLMVLTLFGMSVLIFVMLRLVPGNIADILVDASGIADPKEKAKIAHELGIDRPIVEQYVSWISGLIARRSRLRLRLGAAGDRGDRAAHPDQRQAGRHGAVLLGAARRAVRRDQRGAAEHGARLLPARASVSAGCRYHRFWLGLLVLMASVHWFGTIPIYDNEPHGFLQEVAHARPAGRGGRASEVRR